MLQGDRVYRAIDRLVAAGIVDNIIVGQRPYSRGEVARIFLNAEANFGRLTKPADKMMVYRILKYWISQYADELRDISRCHREEAMGRRGDPENLFVGTGLLPPRQARGRNDDGKWQVHFLDRLDISTLYLDGPDRTVFNNGLGTVNAHVRPLTEYEEGRHFADGFNYAFESYHSLKGPYFVLFAHPRFQLQIREGAAEEEDRVFVQELYGKAGWRNLELEVGRDEVVWGQGENGGLMFSDNARTIDFVKLSNPRPARLPCALRHIGNLKATIFLANMGPHYNFKYSYLTAMKLSVQPATFTEVGFYYGFITGGDGAPSGKADRMGGMDLRFRIPPANDMELYGELYLEDADLDHWAVTFGDKAAYVGGLYFPRLINSNNMALRFEYKHASPAIYRDRTWIDGFTLGGAFLGDPLGPDADGIYASYYYDLGEASRFIARFAYESRGGDTYTVRAGDGGFNVATYRPSEKRYRGTLVLEHPLKKIIRMTWHFGYEAIENYNFTRGDAWNSIIGGVDFSFKLGL